MATTTTTKLTTLSLLFLLITFSSLPQPTEAQGLLSGLLGSKLTPYQFLNP